MGGNCRQTIGDELHKFFVCNTDFSGGNVTIKGDNFNHLSKVLRAEIGDEIVVTDDLLVDYICNINGIFYDHITARVEDYTKNASEPSVNIHLFQCLPKFDKMDSVIQKCVELGVHKIYPVISSRCVTRVDGERGSKKVARWQKISESSAKQSGRGIIPEVSSILDFNDAALLASATDTSVIAYEKEEKIGLRNLDYGNMQSISILIGPEGGFDDAEIEACKRLNIMPVSLGKRILRTETAATTALSVILFMLDNL